MTETEKCSVPDCMNRCYRKSMCQRHYRESANHRYFQRTWQERFWEKVERRGESECWLWTAATIRGYGVLRFPDGNRYAHRLSWEIHHGPIPEGLTVDHYLAAGCTSKACVNPAHLRLLTRAENGSDGARRQNWNPGDTCRRGHRDWKPKSNGDGRFCAECQRQAWRRHDAKRRAARSS